MTCCSFSINFCASSSSWCCIILEKPPSLIIICSFYSGLYTSSSSSHCSAKVIWVSLEIATLPYGGIEMEIDAYHSWRELIYHLFRTDLLQSIFDLFSSVSFENLLSWCCNNVAMIVSSSVSGEHLLIYQAVPLTSYMVNNVNVNIKHYLCFTISCELVRWPTIAKSQPLQNCLPHTCRGRWRGGRWREKCQLGSYTNKRWCEQAQTNQRDVLAQLFVDITEFFPDTTVFYNYKTCVAR